MGTCLSLKRRALSVKMAMSGCVLRRNEARRKYVNAVSWALSRLQGGLDLFPTRTLQGMKSLVFLYVCSRGYLTREKKDKNTPDEKDCVVWCTRLCRDFLRWAIEYSHDPLP